MTFLDLEAAVEASEEEGNCTGDSSKEVEGERDWINAWDEELVVGAVEGILFTLEKKELLMLVEVLKELGAAFPPAMEAELERKGVCDGADVADLTKATPLFNEGKILRDFGFFQSCHHHN